MSSKAKMSRILPIYYMMISFIFLGCILHESYTLSFPMETELDNAYRICVYVSLVYLVALLCIGAKCFVINL